MSQPSFLIRPYRIGDVVDCYEAIQESMEGLSRFMPWCHPGLTFDHLVAWVESKVQAFSERTDFEFVIQSPDGRYLGGCGLNTIDNVNRRANLGYWVRSSAQGLGVATTAIRLLVAWGFENTDLQRLEVVVSTSNQSSLRVAERAGAVREGVLKNRLLLQGQWHDAVMHAFVRG